MNFDVEMTDEVSACGLFWMTILLSTAHPGIIMPALESRF